ncbi:hypothetical protein GGR53DRAFT_502048 [Hypoxylon sp. FL1150]|nr:hypothetical protein GGR53DRAFT_502048 [Hypoxylon sp. FL1150]
METPTPVTPDEYETIRNLPALAPPSGVVPNFENPPNGNTVGISVIIVCSTITIGVSLIRIYTRLFCTKARLEDYLGVLSLPFFISGSLMMAIKTARYPGFFVHEWNLRVKDMDEFIFDYSRITILFSICLMLNKAATLLEWTHLFVPASRNRFFWICHIMMWVNVCLYSSTILVMSWACKPRERIWHRYIPGTCINIDAFNISLSAFHLSFDLLMIIIPNRIIWKLSLTVRQKIGVSMVFSVGIITCLCAGGRLVSSIMMKQSPDTTYAYSRYLIWNIAETTTTKLIFSVTAVPLVFRYPIVLGKLPGFLKLRLPSRLALEDQAQTGVVDTSIHRVPPHQPLNYECPCKEEEVRLSAVETARTRYDHETTLSPGHFYGGILRTTEIAITTTEDGSGRRFGREAKGQQSWLDC